MARRDQPTLDDGPAGVDGRPPLGAAGSPRDQDAVAGPRRASKADEGSADLAAGLAEVGLSPKAAWYSSAVLYGGGGLLVALLYAIDSAIFPPGVFALGLTAIVIGGLCVFAGSRLLG